MNFDLAHQSSGGPPRDLDPALRHLYTKPKTTTTDLLEVLGSPPGLPALALLLQFLEERRDELRAPSEEAHAFITASLEIFGRATGALCEAADENSSHYPVWRRYIALLETLASTPGLAEPAFRQLLGQSRGDEVVQVFRRALHSRLITLRRAHDVARETYPQDELQELFLSLVRREIEELPRNGDRLLREIYLDSRLTGLFRDPRLDQGQVMVVLDRMLGGDLLSGLGAYMDGGPGNDEEEE